MLRFRLVAIAAATYLAVVGLTAWQALIGQSIVQPGGPVLIATVVVALAAVGAAGASLAIAVRGEAARAG